MIELKSLYGSLDRALEKGLEQTWEYMHRCGAGEGHLPIPRSPEALRAIARRWGSAVGVEAAEAFELIRSVR